MEETTPSSGGPIQADDFKRWAVIENNVIHDITFSSFVKDGVEYKNIYSMPAPKLFAAGFYRIVEQQYTVSDFQHAQLMPSTEWTINNEEQIITTKYRMLDHKWEDVKNLIITKVRQNLDAFAAQRGYDNILTAVSYTDSTNETYKNEALIAIKLRDAAWAAVYQLFERVDNNRTPKPISFKQVFDLLPKFDWPI